VPRIGSHWNERSDPVARLVHGDGRKVEAEGKTLNEAICRAALKAVELA